jgi:murein DD-endopeptidase / murein LD-carboxypeptidase
MNFCFNPNVKYLILIIAFCHAVCTSCIKQIYPEVSYQNITSQAEKKALKDFMNSGIGKKINPHKTNANEVISSARFYIGVPHCMGGRTSKCMDCSGLLVTVFDKHGIHLPHNSEEQARYGQIIPDMNELMVGDLVFFVRSYKTNKFITHSGIYMGNNQFIHASSSRGVTITSMNDPWWKSRFIFATRIFD